MKTVSAHGGLVYVALAVYSVTFEGIDSLIENSHQLLNFAVFISSYPGHDCETKMKKKFPYRKLFTIGNFTVRLNNDSATDDLNNFLLKADLSSLWL